MKTENEIRAEIFKLEKDYAHVLDIVQEIAKQVNAEACIRGRRDSEIELRIRALEACKKADEDRYDSAAPGTVKPTPNPDGRCPCSKCSPAKPEPPYKISYGASTPPPASPGYAHMEPPEFRVPKKGDWYISDYDKPGFAWLASCDMSRPRWILRKLPEENKVRVEIELDAELHDKIFHGHKLDASELDAVFQAVRAQII